MTRLLPLLLASCAGSVSPGVPLVAEVAEPATTCPFVVDALVMLELVRTLGDCGERIPLALEMRTERLAVVDGCSGYITTLEMGCGVQMDLTCEGIGRLLGWAELAGGEWLGAVHVSTRHEYDVRGCDGLYSAVEVTLD